MGTSKPPSIIEQYIENQPELTRKALYELRACILSAAPGAVEMLNYNIPAFALIEGGKRDQQIMMAGYKNHVGLYPHPSVMEHFSSELSGYKQGKGSVQFPLNQPLPKDLIIKMIKYRRQVLSGKGKT